MKIPVRILYLVTGALLVYFLLSFETGSVSLFFLVLSIGYFLFGTGILKANKWTHAAVGVSLMGIVLPWGMLFAQQNIIRRGDALELAILFFLVSIPALIVSCVALMVGMASFVISLADKSIKLK